MNPFPQRVDVAVIGLGAAGSAALSALARAGVKAVGIDQFNPPHDRGSSHGETRMLRTAYSEGAAYVPMVHRAIRQWRDLEARTGASLFRQTGVVYGGPPTSAFLAGAREAAKRRDVALAPDAAPAGALAIPVGWHRLLDRDGGYLDAEASIAAFLRDALAQGARIVTDCRCEAITCASDGVTIATTNGALRADRVIVATGAWIGECVPALAAVTHVERRVLHWFNDVGGQCNAASGFRPFLVTTEDDSAFYGFPANAKGEVKVAEHFVVENAASPAALERAVTARDLDFIRPLVSRFLPELGDHIRASVCMYPMSRDEHFIVDALPHERRIVIGAGLSGHGFKFAPVIGEALANLAMDAKQEIDVELFALKRFAEFR
jgi:sarcosine oxidase